MSSVVWALDLAPAVELKKRISMAAFFTGLTVYLEGIVACVLVTEHQLSPSALLPIVPVLVAQLVVIRRPAQRLLRGRLVRSYRVHLLLALAFIGLLWLGAPAGEPRVISVVMGALVVVLPSWPAVRAMRTAKSLRPQLDSVVDPRVLLTCVSFDPMQTMAVKLRSLGGERVRWAAPVVLAGLAMAATAAALALLLRAFGVNAPGSGIAQASTVVAMWTFYRAMRHAKLRASELRARDARPPVLVLRQFGDDTLRSGWLGPATFEHSIAGDLNRVGPTISVGRPGERLQPLGASRDYLTDADWKRVVGALIEDAGVIVFVLGDSESLAWEFRTTVAVRGTRRTLILVPPLRKRVDLERRWEGFARATADSLGAGLPRTLPLKPVLAVFFAGEDAVMIVSRERLARRWWGGARTQPDYRLVLRLFECLLPENITSIRALEAFVNRHLPILGLSGSEPVSIR